jgi:CRP-like cAMP-binding protein
MSTGQLELIATLCEEHHYEVGDIVFAEGTRGSELYVIADGAVDIILDPALIAPGEGSEGITVATLRRGQCFGEVALVDEGQRSAAARCAAHATHLLVIPRDRLMRLCDENPALGYRLMRNLAADLAMKIRNTDLAVREKILWANRP